MLGQSFFNPRRAIVSTCLLSSNHSRDTRFILLESNEDAYCEEELELKNNSELQEVDAENCVGELRVASSLCVLFPGEGPFIVKPRP